jgi:hypothetical protein
VGVDSAGNVYVPDTYNNRIVKFAPDGSYVTDWSGWGQVTIPGSVAVDSASIVYVVDWHQENRTNILKFAPPQNTPEGMLVEVDAGEGVSVLFGEVTTAGNTTAVRSTEPPPGSPTSSAFQFLGEYWEITTTAEYTPGITIALAYDDTGLSQQEEEALVLLHYDETLAEWVDVTSSVDTVNNVIYGNSESLSCFAVAIQVLRPSWVPPLHADTTATSPDGPFKGGRTIPVKFRLLNLQGEAISDAEAGALTTELHVFYESAGAEGAPVDPGDNPPDVGGEFRYDTEEDLFIYNLSTKGGGWLADYTYRLEMAVDGIKAGAVFFSLR